MNRRILLISRCPPYPLHLGDRLIIGHLARHLKQRGYVLDLIALAQSPEDHQQIQQYAQDFRNITLIDEEPRSPASYLWRLLYAPARFPRHAQDSWSAPMWEAITAHLNQHEYDLVHLFGGIQVYEFAHLVQGYPNIITPYESYSLYLKRAVQQHGGVVNRVQRLIARKFESWMFSPYQHTVVLTGQDRDELREINPDLSIEIIPNGVDLRYFANESEEPRAPATLLFIGNYDYPPNRDAAWFLATQIFPKIRQQIPQARLQLVGNAPDSALQALASDAIEVTGRVPDVRPYLAQATVFACPLRVGAGIKNKVLEALAMGIPTVASPLSLDGIAVTVGEDVIRAGLDHFVEALLGLLNNPALQRQLSQAGPRKIQTQYSWASVADRYEALYRRTLEQEE